MKTMSFFPFPTEDCNPKNICFLSTTALCKVYKMNFNAYIPPIGVRKNSTQPKKEKPSLFVGKGDGKTYYRFPDGKVAEVKTETVVQKFRNLNSFSRNWAKVRTSQYDGVSITTKEAYVNRRMAGLS